MNYPAIIIAVYLYYTGYRLAHTAFMGMHFYGDHRKPMIALNLIMAFLCLASSSAFVIHQLMF